MDRDFTVAFISDRGWKTEDQIEMIRIIREEYGSRIEFHLYRPHLTYEIIDFNELHTIAKNREQGRLSIWMTSVEGDAAYSLDIPTPLADGPDRVARFHCGNYHGLFDWSNDENGKNMQKLLNVFRTVHSALRPFHGFLATGDDPNNFFVTAHGPSSAGYEKRYEFLLNEINLFGPEAADRIGRDRLGALKAHTVEELEGGGMLVVPVALNHPDYDRRYFESGDFRIPLDPKCVDWYCRSTGLKRQPRPRRFFW